MMREVIAANIDEIHAALAIPPQTNEVGRSAALLAGLCDLVAASGVRRIRLLEVGPSAGLNLIVDHYAYRGDTWQFGLHRHERLEAALDIAISHPVRVDKAQASDWLPQALGLAEAETLTVVWHSITQMYWLPEEVAAVEAIMRTAGAAQLLGKSAWSSSSTAIRTELNLSFALDCGASTHIPRVSDCLAQRTITASRSDSQAARADCVRPAQRMTWHQLLALGISSNWCQVTPTDAK